MSNFPRESHFSKDHPSQTIGLFKADNNVPSVSISQTTSDDLVSVDKKDLESWYQDANDLVRTLGVSVSTGSHMPRKDYQKRSHGHNALDVRELHDRLTDHRDSIYRYVK